MQTFGTTDFSDALPAGPTGDTTEDCYVMQVLTGPPVVYRESIVAISPEEIAMRTLDGTVSLLRYPSNRCSFNFKLIDGVQAISPSSSI